LFGVRARLGQNVSSKELSSGIKVNFFIFSDYIFLGHALFFDATAYGSDAIEGCYQSDCSFTDKWVVDNEAECARVCTRVRREFY
jgi:hypothetical protein